jgi:hypothetical protein
MYNRNNSVVATNTAYAKNSYKEESSECEGLSTTVLLIHYRKPFLSTKINIFFEKYT